MSNLQTIFKPTTSTKSNSSKTPAFYNREKSLLIEELAASSNAQIRSAIASNSHTPTKVLVSILETEQDKTVLRLALMNDKMPRKAVAKFVSNSEDRRVEWFENDEELIAHYKRD